MNLRANFAQKNIHVLAQFHHVDDPINLTSHLEVLIQPALAAGVFVTIAAIEEGEAE